MPINDNNKLRRADFITSIVLILFALFIIAEALQMPINATYGGVSDVWYVSPALMPFIIGAVILLISSLLMRHAIRSGGARYFFDSIAKVRWGVSDANFRFIAILLVLISIVYLYIPRVDFFLDGVLLLIYFISIFYFDDMKILKKATAFYSIGAVFFIVVFASGLGRELNQLFQYATDVLMLLMIIGQWGFTRALVRGNPVLKRKLRITLITAIVAPLVLVPVFKYFLLVPLPYEGGIVQLMDLIRYSFGK